MFDKDETYQAMARKANSKGSNVTLKEVARALGVSTMTISRAIKAIDSLRSKRVDGIMVSSSQTEDDYTHYRQVINSGLPFVFFDRCIEVTALELKTNK